MKTKVTPCSENKGGTHPTGGGTAALLLGAKEQQKENIPDREAARRRCFVERKT